MRKRSNPQINFIETGLSVLIEGAGSISGFLYGPINGMMLEDGRVALQMFIKTPTHFPLGNTDANYKIRFVAANLATEAVQIGRYRDEGSMYFVRVALTTDEIQQVSSALSYNKLREGMGQVIKMLTN